MVSNSIFTPEKIADFRANCKEIQPVDFPSPREFAMIKIVEAMPAALDEIERLRDELADYTQGRPMETAPKDGINILVRICAYDITYFDVIFWFRDRWIQKASPINNQVFDCWWPLPGGYK